MVPWLQSYLSVLRSIPFEWQTYYYLSMIPEPPPWSTIRFTKGRHYTYVCHRIHTDDGDDYCWYTTASFDRPYDLDALDADEDGEFGKVSTWKQIVRFIGDDEVELATAWKPLVRY